MAFAQITGIIIILFGISIGLVHFNLISSTVLGFNIVTIGILFFMLHEAYALIRNLSSDTNKIISVGVPLLFILIAGSNFIRPYLPGLIASNLTLIITILMIVEGLYRLH